MIKKDTVFVIAFLACFSLVAKAEIKKASAPEVKKAAINALDALDDYTKTPEEVLMEETAKELDGAIRILLAPEQLDRLSMKQKEMFAGVVEHERQINELTKHPDFEVQQKHFTQLSAEYEKKGNTEEIFAAFIKRAEVECPLALHYATSMNSLAQFKSMLGELFKDAFFDSLNKIKLPAPAVQ